MTPLTTFILILIFSTLTNIFYINYLVNKKVEATFAKNFKQQNEKIKKEIDFFLVNTTEKEKEKTEEILEELEKIKMEEIKGEKELLEKLRKDIEKKHNN